MLATLGLVAGGVQASASGTAASTAASAAPSNRTVAHSPDGRMASTIKGRTAQGDQVTGSFIPLRFSQKNGQVLVKGLVQGVDPPGHRQPHLHGRAHGARWTRRTVRRWDGAGSAAATCDILHLVLGPLDLDLLGLQVHLNRVVLDIVAVDRRGQPARQPALRRHRAARRPCSAVSSVSW